MMHIMADTKVEMMVAMLCVFMLLVVEAVHHIYLDLLVV